MNDFTKTEADMIGANTVKVTEQNVEFFQNASQSSALSNRNYILIVDDDCDILDRLSQSFAICASHYTILTARNGREAIGVLQSYPVNILLTALHMPVMNGFSLMNYTNNYYPSTRTFVMSGDEPSAVMNNLPSSGIHGYIKKPFAIETIYSMLRL
jgi:YesN/AraC family two-component response regulator